MGWGQVCAAAETSRAEAAKAKAVAVSDDDLAQLQVGCHRGQVHGGGEVLGVHGPGCGGSGPDCGGQGGGRGGRGAPLATPWPL